ncbi:uncharacterized protein G2W53_026470 [Senna tora]|uniref:Uncharacterized protein n=1 Tax=Senna tora TaxID=362788 RepID=A0A834WF46_9FABA|nr:uncharacterized protein G2W53_026470 [Senna tora]
MAWEKRGSCLNIFRTTNWCRMSETFKNYDAKDLLRKSKKHSRITRQKTCCSIELNTLVRVVFVNRSGFDAPIEVVMAWEEGGSCLNISRTTNRGQISETFTNYKAKDLLRKSKKPSRITRQKTSCAIGSQKPSQITRKKTCCARELNTSVRFVFANPSGYDAPIGVFMAWEERGSCLNIFRTTNRGRISETFTNYEAKDLLRKFALYLRTGVVLMLQLESSWHRRSVDHVLTYSGQEIGVGSQKPSPITRQKTCCASELNTSVCFVFANTSGYDAPIGVFMAWKERGSCLNIFQTTNRGRISETFMNYEAKDLLCK